MNLSLRNDTSCAQTCNDGCAGGNPASRSGHWKLASSASPTLLCLYRLRSSQVVVYLTKVRCLHSVTLIAYEAASATYHAQESSA